MNDFELLEAIEVPVERVYRRDPAVIEALLSRRSIGLLRDPAPDDADLGLILDSALRAPDHGRLRPWRIVLIRGAARAAFADLLIEALGRRQENPAAAQVRRLWTRMTSVPLLLAVGAKIRVDVPIPEIEQVLCTGAAVMNMLNALHALGYGGMWVTGAHVYDRTVNEALGFVWPDRLVGLLLTGTPSGEPRQLPRPLRSAHVREWHRPNAHLWNPVTDGPAVT